MRLDGSGADRLKTAAMSVPMTPEDLTKLIDAAVQGVLRGQRSAGSGGRELDERYFRRVDKFDGKGSWREFSFQFKTAVGMVNPKARDQLDEIQKAGKGVDMDSIFVEEEEAQTSKVGSELYAILTTLMTGEAMTVVRGVLGGNGWQAWSRLCIRFDPRTPAKALISMLAVMNPKKVKEIRHLASAIDDWEAKVKALDVEHDIELEEKIQVAILTSLCPGDVQDLIFQWADDKAKYNDIKDKIVALAQNRAAMSRPTPMEVDQVKEESGENEEEYEVEIDYVGETCRRCGGMGHYARECPTPKGKGTGGKGDGKGWGKSSSKGGQGYYGKGAHKGGYKGDGKGREDGKGRGGKGPFSGVCWNCQQAGHRAWECPKNKDVNDNMEIGAVQEDYSTTVGGVWAIAQVQAEEWTVIKEKGRRADRKDGEKVQVANRFQVLEAEEDGLEDGSGCGGHDLLKDSPSKWPLLRTGAKCCSRSRRCKKWIGGAGSGMEVQEMDAETPPGLETRQICTVTTGKKGWRRIGLGEITIDSAAEESVCPREWCKEFGTKDPEKWLKFVNASGGAMGHYGERTAKFKVEGENSAIMSLNFQVSDVQKPLAAVRRIVEKGNIVQFGPRDEDNFVVNAVGGVKVMMVKKGGSCVIPAEMVMEEQGFARQAR